MKQIWLILIKELKDALRDRRTLFAVLLSSVAVGPLILGLMSIMMADMESRAEAREIVVSGMEHAPTLRNFLERQTYRVKPAPLDFELQLSNSKLGDPVLVIPANFESKLASGELPTVEVYTSSVNQRASRSTGRITTLLRSFNQEQATLRLASRGVASNLLTAMQVQERDLADPAARASQITAMVPFFVLMAVLYGAMTAAIDSMAGERERGSLEPLLMNPVSPMRLVIGKWAAVSAVGMLISILSCLSFLPGQWLIQSENLSAMFRFDWREAGAFLLLLLPLAGMLSALLMAIAIRCKSIKEAQANTTIVILVISMAPLVLVLNQSGEAPWHLGVPVLAQLTLMSRVLKGESMLLPEILVPLAVCIVLSLLCLAYVAHKVRKAAVA